MAISLRGTPTSPTAVSSGNITVTLPTGTTTGDYVLVWIAYRSNAAFSAPDAYWTKLQESNTGDTDATFGVGSGVLFGGYYNASMGLTFTRTGGDVAQASCVALQGVASSGALESSGIALNAYGTSCSVAGGTPTTADSWVFSFIAVADNGTVSSGPSSSNSNPSSWSEVINVGTGTGADCGIAVHYGTAAASAVGNITATTNINGQHVSARAILKPAPTPRTPGTGTITLTGSQPTALVPIWCTPGTGAIALTGAQPTLDLAWSPSQSFVAASSIETSYQSLTFSQSPSELTGDDGAAIVVAFIWVSAEAVLTTPTGTGWTVIGDTQYGAVAWSSGTNDTALTCYTSDAANVSGVQVAYDGRDTDNPINLTTTTDVFGDSTPTVTPTGGTHIAGSVALYFCGIQDSFTDATDPDAYRRSFGAGGVAFERDLADASTPPDIELGISSASDSVVAYVELRPFSGAATKSPPAGSLGLTGTAASLALATAIGLGGLALIGAAPTLSHGTPLAVPAGGTAWTGTAPTLSQQTAIGTGSLSLAGALPALQLARAVPSGAVALAGAEPMLWIVTGSISPPTGSLSLIGGYVRRGVPGPDTGEIVLTGAVPIITVGADVGPTPATGQLTLVGSTPALEHRLAIATSGVSVTGAAPTIAQTLLVGMPAGAIAVTGATPAMAQSIAVGAGTVQWVGTSSRIDSAIAFDAGALVLTGAQPVVLSPVIVAPDAGTVVLTGIEPTLGGAGARPVAAGLITLTGQAVTLAQPILTTAGIVTLTGAAPVRDGGCRPTLGAVTIAGQAPGVHRALVVPAGTCFLNGIAPGVQCGIAPATGTLTTTGLTPTLARWEAVPAGTVIFSGQAPTALTAGMMAPGTGEITFLGQPPGILQVVTIAVPAGTAGLTGTAPIRDAGWRPAAGVVTLTGVAPSLAVGVGRTIPAGTLTLTGASPGAAWTIASGTGTLTVTGQAPAALTAGLVPVPSGAVWLAAGTPTLASGVLAPAGSLSLSLTTPRRDNGRLPGAAQLALTGQLPTLAQRAVVPAGLVILQGAAPFTGSQATAQVPAGALVVAGAAPRRDAGCRPTAATLTLTGTIPILAIRVAPAAGLLTLTATAPELVARVYPAAGVVTLTGTLPLRDAGRLPAAATLTLTLTTPTLASVTVVPATPLLLVGQLPVAKMTFATLPLVATDIAAWLRTRGLTNVYVGALPDDELAVAVREARGRPATRAFNGEVLWEHPRLAVYVGGATYAETRAVAEEVYAALLAVHNLYLDMVWYAEVRPRLPQHVPTPQRVLFLIEADVSKELLAS